MNHKALLASASQEDDTFPDWVPFNNEELRRHVRARTVHGLDPSPQVSTKFNSQNDGSASGNSFVNRSLGPAAVRRHNHFRRFLLHRIQLKQHQAAHLDQTGR